MSVRRSSNFLNQQRIDTPHLRSIESAVRNDFDELIASFATGKSKSYVLRGFELSVTASTIGSSASSLQMIVDDSALFHGQSNASGTFLAIDSGTANETLNSTTNTKVNGAFTPNALNYIGLELKRTVDTSTASQVFFWNPTNQTEFSKSVPLSQTFDYEIVITSTVWASNVLPIAVVQTDSSNAIVSIEDRRPMYFRLGSGGTSTPDQFNNYAWSEGRAENFWRTTSSTSPFEGGDKVIRTDKEWKDAVMTLFKEVVGGPFWYSFNKAGSLLKLKGDLAHTQMTGNGKFIHAESTAGQINWSSDILINFIGSRLSYKIDVNATPGSDLILSDDQVAYINLVRGVAIVPNLVFTNGSAIVTSVGAVSWTGDVLAGDYIKIGSEDDTRYFQIQSVDTASQVTLTENFDGTSTGSGGVQAQYAYGFYQVVNTPSTNRHIQIDDRKDVPFNEDVYWLFLRADNGGATARVYIRGSSGGELQQGEEREISDNQTLDVLEYIGSPSEADSTPDYTNAIVVGVAEETTVVMDAASTITSGQYGVIYSALDIKKYYVWANKDGAGGDPAPAGLEEIEVAIAGADNAIAVAGAFATAIDAKGEFNVVDNLDGSFTITNSQVGIATDAFNFNLGAGGTSPATIYSEVSATSTLSIDDALDRGGQVFSHTNNFELDEVDFRISRSGGSPDYDLVVDIYDEVAGEPGSVIATSDNAVNASTALTYPSETTFTYQFTGVNLLASTNYYAVLRPTNIVTLDGANFVVLRNASGGSGGVRSDDGGATWFTSSNDRSGEIRVNEVTGGGTITFTTDVQGAGAFNHVIVDGDNLTKSIKRLDGEVQGLSDALDAEPYEEIIDIISAAPSNDREITGPVSSGTSVKIPKNTRDSDIQTTYAIGEADLVVFLNGHRLCVGKDYTESSTTEVTFTFDLQVGDLLKFTKAEVIGSTGGGSASGQNLGSVSDANVFKQTAGTVLQFRRLTAGANINITENSEDVVIAATPGVAPSNTQSVIGTNYNVTTSDNIILVQNNATDVTLTLPDAATAEGVIWNIKKIDAGNTLFIKSTSGQTLDGVNIDATPHSITIQNENITITAVNGNFYIL